MVDVYEDFSYDYGLTYGEGWEEVHSVVQKLLGNGEGGSETCGKWEGSSRIVKHDRLNYTYEITLNSIDDEDQEIHLEFYTGIDVGCELVDYSFGGGASLPTTSVRVAVGVKPDWSRYPTTLTENRKKLIIDVITGREDELLELHKKESYDNYVTGGGTVATNKHYKEKFDSYKERNIFFEFVYEDVIVDKNYI